MEKLYKDMTTTEQLHWLTDFSAFAQDKLARLELVGDTWEQTSIKDIEEGMMLINAFAYARDFVKASLCFQDYSRRIDRLRYYVERIKKDIAKGMTVRGANGETYAYIPALQGQSRRRGRPTREERLARAMGKDTDAAVENEQIEKEKKIAALLGMEIVTAEPKREKNNDELAAERAEKEAKATAGQQLLFTDMQEQVAEAQSTAEMVQDDVADIQQDVADIKQRVAQLEATAERSVQSPTLSSQMPRLSELKWLLPTELAAEVDNIRAYRATAAASAEKAKTMAEMGAKSDDVKPYSEEAAAMTDHYESIYERVDRELAIVYVRLREDEHYTAKFKTEHHVTDTADIVAALKPYFNKQDKDFADRVRKIIDDENPETVARREAEKQTKERVDAIVKYIMRKDKKPSAQRVATLEKRIDELEQLRGKEFADIYRPILDKTREEVAAQASEKASNDESNKETNKASNETNKQETKQ